MALFNFAPMIVETTTTEGSGDITLAGAATGYLAFSDLLTVGEYTGVMVEAGGQWELLSGRLASSTLLDDLTPVKNSSGNSTKIDWASGTKNVACVYLPEKFLRKSSGGKYVADQTLRFEEGSNVYDLSIGDVSGNLVFERDPDGTPVKFLQYDVSSNIVETQVRMKSTVELEAPSIKLNGDSLQSAATKEAAPETGTAPGEVPVLDASSLLNRTRLPDFVGATDVAVGQKGAVPAPAAGKENSYLRMDGSLVYVVKRVEQAWTANPTTQTVYTFAHGLSAYPDRYYVEVELTGDSDGWLTGERFVASGPTYKGSARGCMVVADATNVRYSWRSAVVLDASGNSAIADIPNASIKIRAVAEKWEVLA